MTKSIFDVLKNELKPVGRPLDRLELQFYQDPRNNDKDRAQLRAIFKMSPFSTLVGKIDAGSDGIGGFLSWGIYSIEPYQNELGYKIVILPLGEKKEVL